MPQLHPTIAAVTAAIEARSLESRAAYDAELAASIPKATARSCVACGNLAHVAAAMPGEDKRRLAAPTGANLAIVTAYNDMLSAHEPFAEYPPLIKAAARASGAMAQVAGGVPAMCDGVTQGQPGMELSLFSRDVIAMSTAVALTHNVFDGAICLGTCDKIVPGLLMGALGFPHLPVMFSPAGPMATGISNSEKARVRQLHAEGKLGAEALLDSEMKAYHSPGTCTFYGTANSNQVLVEVMGLHMPGTAFAHPRTGLREALLTAAVERLVAISAEGDAYTPIGRIVGAKTIVNALVALLATGGSTNHTIHWIAVARAAGLIVTWDDFDALSKVVPLLARVYPNGAADVNAFEAAGGIGFLVKECLAHGLMHEDVDTVAGPGLSRYAVTPALVDGRLVYRPAPETSRDESVLRPAAAPFEAESGLKILVGTLGRSVIKTSAVKPEQRRITAPARVFDGQDAFLAAFKRGEFTSDMVAVIRFQGPKANGMPELHKLTPSLAVLQDRGLKVALVTDGRMSGASGKVAAAIHLTPEAVDGGPIARLRDGDVIALDGDAGRLDIVVDAAEFAARTPAPAPAVSRSLGRGLFAALRAQVGPADEGASLVGALV
ncbi:MAG: phosphogluconate dehydratase [Hyphomicrobiaceae bacterium]|nr:phosphogluconate dehydratase [Hyphomicrobiaceae bacterium]